MLYLCPYRQRRHASKKQEGVRHEDKELRKLIGSRAKQRRVELGLNQPYVAEKMGVATSQSCAMRQGQSTTQEAGFGRSVGSTPCVCGVVKRETEEYETNITDKRNYSFVNVMSSISLKAAFDMEKAESDLQGFTAADVKGI